MAPSDPEVIVDEVGNLSAVGLLFLQTDSPFEQEELWMILFSAEAILASSTSKFGIEIPRIDDEDLNSSTESTNSTSLIHCIASVGNCEQVTYLGLEPYLPASEGCWRRELVKVEIREICSRCWSAP